MPNPRYQLSSAALACPLTAAIPASPKALTSFMLFSMLSSCALRGRNVDYGVDHGGAGGEHQRSSIQPRDDDGGSTRGGAERDRCTPDHGSLHLRAGVDHRARWDV